MAWVYILKTNSNKYYVGSTTDLSRRLKQHQTGHTPSTKRLRADSLLLHQKYPTLREARAVENKIKKLKSKKYIDKMIEDGYIKIRP